MFKTWSVLSQRLLVGSIASILIFLAIIFSFHPWAKFFLPLILIGLAFFALKEFYTIARAKGLVPLEKLGFATCMLYIGAVYYSFFGPPAAAFLPQLVAWTSLAVAFAYFFLYSFAPLLNIAATALGIIYIVFPLSLGLSINYLFLNDSGQDGRFWLFYLLVVTKISDIAAYAIGKKWGRRPLCPYLSPNKTWEGAVAGILTAILASLAFELCSYAFCPAGILHLSPLTAIVLGAILGLLAAFGDLAESLLKRDSHIKDSSRLPGVGGILDMLDSLLFAIPALYLFLQMRYALAP